MKRPSLFLRYPKWKEPMKPRALTIQLPNWIHRFGDALSQVYSTEEDRMRLALLLAQENIRQQTGGPFAAAVFNQMGGEVLAVGVNLVTTQNCSLAHAETIALACAQQHLGQYSLDPQHTGFACQLVTTVEPCAMCLGAIPWSGIKSLVCGASGQQAEAIGFDEGTKPEPWSETLKARGIEVQRGVLQEEANQILVDYRTQGGVIY